MGKAKRRFIIFIATAVLLFCGLLPFTALNAYAEDYDALIPSFGLYCYDKQVDMRGNVSINMADDEQFKSGLAQMQAEYYASAGGQEVVFSLPFLARAMDMQNIKVYVDDLPVDGQLYYGDKRAIIYENTDMEEAIENAFPIELDETIKGTLYEVIPDAETITVSFTLSEGQSLIYQTSNQLSSSHSVRHMEITMYNALMESKYQFFVMGDISQEEFTASCEVQKREMTCKSYIDEVYAAGKEYYDTCGKTPVEFLYSQVNAIIAEKRFCEFGDLFFDSIKQYRVNLFKFSAAVSENTKISFSYALNIQYDTHYKPTVYKIKQIHSGNYPVDFKVKLNNSNPYVLLDSGSIKPDNREYTAECINEDFTCAFSASANPVDWLQQQREQEEKDARTRLIILIVCGVVGGVGITILIAMLVWHFNLRFRNRR